MASGNDVNFRIGGDASGALRENDKHIRSNKQVERSFEDNAKASSTTAKRIIRDIETQSERYNRLQKESRAAYMAGQIGADQYGRRVRQLQTDYNTQQGAFKKFATETKSDLGELEEGANDFGDAIGSWAVRAGSALSAVQLFRQGFQAAEEAIESSKASVIGRRTSAGSLRQLANTQAELDELRDTAKQFRLAGAVGSVGEGEQVTFSLGSADFLDEETKKLFLQLGAKQVVPDLAKFSRAVRTQVSSFGVSETGDAVQIASKAFAASAFSPASVEELLEASAQVGGTAQSLGISDEETLAATALLATSTGKPTVGSSTLRAFLNATAQLDGFEGLGIRERVRKLAGQELSAKQLLQSPSKGGLGSVEAVRAFNDLNKDLPKLQRATQRVQGANFDRSAIDRKLALKDPLAEAARLSEVSKAKAEINNGNLAARRLITDGILERGEAEAVANLPAGIANLGIGATRVLGGAAELAFGQPGIESFIQGQQLGATPGETAQLEQLQKQTDSIDKLVASVERLLGEQIVEQKETNRQLSDSEGGLITTNE